MKGKVESVAWRETSDDNDEGQYVVTVLSKSPNAPSKVESEEQFDALILATGSFPIGHEIARSLGHKIVKTVPSLFTLSDLVPRIW